MSVRRKAELCAADCKLVQIYLSVCSMRYQYQSSRVSYKSWIAACVHLHAVCKKENGGEPTSPQRRPQRSPRQR